MIVFAASVSVIVCQTTTSTKTAIATTSTTTTVSSTTSFTSPTTAALNVTTTPTMTTNLTMQAKNVTDEIIIPCNTAADCVWSCVSSSCVSLSLLWNESARKRADAICVTAKVNVRDAPGGKILRSLAAGKEFLRFFFSLTCLYIVI